VRLETRELLWLTFRLAPFVPTIDWQKHKNALKPLLLEPQIGALETFRYLAGWMVVGYVVQHIWRRPEALLHVERHNEPAPEALRRRSPAADR
jgi:hypothetical protein